jgi:WD40 repeat protein
MRARVYLLLNIVFAYSTSCVTYAQNGSILWAHGAGLGSYSFTSIYASKRLDRILMTGGDACQSWSMNNRSLPTTLPVNLNAPPACAVSVKNDTEVIMGVGGTICSWNTVTNSFTSIFTFLNDINYINATPDGNLIAVETENDWTLHLYDRAQGEEVGSWTNCYSPIAFSPDGKLLLTGFKVLNDSSLTLIDAQSHAIIRHFSMRMLPSEAYSMPSAIVFSPVSSGMFAVANEYGVIEMDSNGKILASLPVVTLFGNNNTISYSPDGSLIAAADPTGNISVLRTTDGSSISLPGGAWFISFLDDDTLAATDGGDVYLFSVSQQSYLGTLSAHLGQIFSIVYSNDGTKLLSSGQDGDAGSFRLWDASTGSLLSVNSLGGDPFVASGNLSAIVSYDDEGWMGFRSSISDSAKQIRGDITNIGNFVNVVFSPTDTIFASAVELFEEDTNYPDKRQALQLWSTTSLSMIREFDDEPYYAISCVAFSNDGSMVAAVEEGFYCYVWDVYDGHLISTLTGITSTISNVTFLPGDTTVLLGCDDRSFVISRVTDNHSYAVQTSEVDWGTIELLPGGKQFAEMQPQGYNDSVADIVDIATGATVQRLCASGELLRAVAVNPVTGDVATGGYDGSIVVWKGLGTAGVKQTSALSEQPLEAFATNNHIKIDLPVGAESGRVFVYRTDGRCFFSSGVEAGESTVATSELPSGVYFIVYEPSSGQRSFTKVSLFQ